MTTRLPGQFLFYCVPEQADRDRGRTLNHSASEQFDRLHLGDTLWTVTVRAGRLYLMGPMTVDGKGSAAKAARFLGEPAENLYEATHHVWQSRGATPSKEVDISAFAGRIRFQSRFNDRLQVKKTEVNPEQLQSMRRLTSQSHALLTQVWKRAHR